MTIKLWRVNGTHVDNSHLQIHKSSLVFFVVEVKINLINTSH